jgi:hypothetical protein
MITSSLDKIVIKLEQENTTVEGYYDWLKVAIEDIVLNGVMPPFAFGYLIGRNGDDWQQDLRYIVSKLSHRSQHHFKMAIVECLRYLPVSASQSSANAPSSNGGRNVEQLALTYLELVRELRIKEAMKYVAHTIQNKLTQSVIVFDAALLTWRIMPDADPGVDWPKLFTQDTANRFQYKYSGLVALGMCLANPTKAIYFLEDWEPLKKYLDTVIRFQEPSSVEHIKKLASVINELRRTLKTQATANTCKPIDIIELSTTGSPINLAVRLKGAANAGRAKSLWQLPASFQSRGIRRTLNSLEGQYESEYA